MPFEDGGICSRVGHQIFAGLFWGKDQHMRVEQVMNTTVLRHGLHADVEGV